MIGHLLPDRTACNILPCQNEDELTATSIRHCPLLAQVETRFLLNNFIQIDLPAVIIKTAKENALPERVVDDMPIRKPQHQTPSVMNCPMLQIVEGCTHNKCHFCDIYRDVSFHKCPIDEIESDLDAMAKVSRLDQYRINLIGGNPYSLSVEQLVPILDLVKNKLPHVSSFGGFCRIADVKNKSDEELALLASYGVNDLSIGAEGGHDPALTFMEKGHTSADIIEQGQRLHKAGIDFTFFYLAGMAGAGKGQENALASAEVFSAAAPGHILIVCITPTQGWPLAADIEAGRWEPPSETEMIEEIYTFIENLKCDTYINCSHDTDVIKFEGLIPKDQENILRLIENRLPKINPDAARRLREMIHKAKF